MEIIMRDERIPKNCYECSYLNYCSLNPNFKPTISKCPLKPLSQHDAEVRAEEKKKVLAELKTNYGGIEKDIITEKYHLTNFDCDITKPIKQIIKEAMKKKWRKKMKTINLKFKNTITSLAGNLYGKSVFDNQCQDMDFSSEYDIVFPDQIKRIATSFIQGFFHDIIKNIGIIGISEKINISSNEIINIKQFVLDCLS